MRRDWPGWMLVTLGTLGPELTMVGRERLTPGTEGRDTETREGPGLTPALVTRPARYRGQENASSSMIRLTRCDCIGRVTGIRAGVVIDNLGAIQSTQICSDNMR